MTLFSIKHRRYRCLYLLLPLLHPLFSSFPLHFLPDPLSFSSRLHLFCLKDLCADWNAGFLVFNNFHDEYACVVLVRGSANQPIDQRSHNIEKWDLRGSTKKHRFTASYLQLTSWLSAEYKVTYYFVYIISAFLGGKECPSTLKGFVLLLTLVILKVAARLFVPKYA